ncbi:MAG: inositol monophosphatase family protein [Candidatus Aminicenantales bacterium]
MNAYLEAAAEAAREAGVFLRENLGVSPEVSFKGEVDLVTDMDRRAQELIFRRIAKGFPEHDILAEEGLSREKGSEFLWIIDPLDGTTNYAHGFPIFTVSIALARKGEVVCGVVHDPMRNETFAAVKGEGAFCNGKKIGVSRVGELDKSLVATGFPYDLRESEENNIDHFNHFLTRVQAIRRCGSAAMDLCYVACGRFDGFWELKLMPWDVAAGALIVEEAGGRMSDFKGQAFDIYGKETLASNGLIHEQMIAVLGMGRREAAE